MCGEVGEHDEAISVSGTSKHGAPSILDGSRMSSVAIVFDLGQTCQDESFARTVNAVNRNPIIERIVPTASPIDLATIADVCDVGDSMEERPLFPATRSGSLAI